MRGLGQNDITCLTEGQAVFMGACIAQMPPPGMTPESFEYACAGMQPYMNLPYCPNTTRLPIPSCLSEEEVKGIDYCNYGDGSSAYWNALCWGAKKDPAWWQTYTSTQPCPGVTAPMASPLMQQDQSSDVEAPPAEKSNMMLYAMLGLGGLLVIGLGVYFARKS